MQNDTNLDALIRRHHDAVVRWTMLDSIAHLREVNAAEAALRARAEAAEADADQLRDFAIWMTGCGYDFASVPAFRERQHLLIKKEPTDDKA